MADDYHLGVGDSERYRLGVQHRVWRTIALEAWRACAIGRGTRVIDAGAGPGYAALDLSELVEDTGQVFALERAAPFRESLEASARARGLTNIHVAAVDLAEDPIPVVNVDAVWVRWVFAFLADPITLLARLSDALRPGGRIAFQEYLDWRTFNLTPRPAVFDTFVDETLSAWRSTGGEPDAARLLLPALAACGLRLVSVTPHILTVGPHDLAWRWPATFIGPHAQALEAAGRGPAGWAQEMVDAFAAASSEPSTLLTTPFFVTVIAEKL